MWLAWAPAACLAQRPPPRHFEPRPGCPLRVLGWAFTPTEIDALQTLMQSW